MKQKCAKTSENPIILNFENVFEKDDYVEKFGIFIDFSRRM